MEGGIVLEAAGEISEEAGARWSVLASWRLPDAGTKAASFGRPDLVKAASLEKDTGCREGGGRRLPRGRRRPSRGHQIMWRLAP
jgi:hypothetical protein